jgi:hypothetical protein
MATQMMAERMMSNITGVPMGLYPGASPSGQLGSIVNGLMRPPMGGMMGGPMMGGNMGNLLRNFGL